MNELQTREEVLRRNLESIQKISPDIAQTIRSTKILGELVQTPAGYPTLQIDSMLLHSSRDPWTEVTRQLSELKKEDEERVFLFFGAGLGYSVQYALEFPKVSCVWMEPNPGILKLALSIYDFSGHLEENRLRILLPPYNEASLYEGFKGILGLPVTFIPHRGSLQWRSFDYQELRFVSEAFFHKKDVNTATLTRFEKVWTKNFLLNLPEMVQLEPLRSLFGLCAGKVDIVVCGAGPSLSESLEELRSYRDRFVLIAVDTSLAVLQKFGIDPDLVFSVDPQPLNSKYLEEYSGNARFVFDPTTSYHSMRLPSVQLGGFVSSSPFPWIKLIEERWLGDLGKVDFGGSVSTNAASLAEKMVARSVLLIGQDLSFPGNLAHCKGAVLEERLNHLESRKFRREHHNYKQMTALPPKWVPSIQGEKLRTNEKLLIFKKWFEEHPKTCPWINLSRNGVILEGISTEKISEYYKRNPADTSFASKVKEKISSFSTPNRDLDLQSLIQDIRKLEIELKEFLSSIETGVNLSGEVYDLISEGGKDRLKIQNSLRELSKIDEVVTAKKGLTEYLGLSLQRVILTITEGYETSLSLEEKKNEQLAIAKKSLLLYEGLQQATRASIRLLKHSAKRIEFSSVPGR
ncbi:hypothetical protein CH373_02120 [Leptospira perolatii]|uniref:6-hydroxymethylpterin diphosphokinase MptE-like domain-containing protein n=1 Tax=Leptospira perolatii TaxID=2023191 RepID=A0A2M9ZS14_9LEPT|nr:6-hydroxymethylpterin diphosphokinase MptE-like protein [Leptospira perolatii]PJZ71322.1 hypothetical protein CH360_02120 [Leptospira perolatii]PJZ74856.1 hypothetical protein CH373_02120 [Leptospira perolatii]